MQENCKIPENLRQELENIDIPLAVYVFDDGHVKTEIVSDGLVPWLGPDATREKMIRFLNTDTYKDIHNDDIVFVAAKTREFFNQEDGRYELVYRQKLYGKEKYHVVHAVGYHSFLDNGTKYTVIVYDDITSALESNSQSRGDFDNDVVSLLNTAKVDPFIIFDANTREIYMVSASIEQFWKPAKPFELGIKLEEYLFSDKEKESLPIQQVLDKEESIVRNPRTGNDLIIKVSQIAWHGNQSVFLRISEHSDRYFDPLTGLPNIEYGRVCGDDFIAEVKNAGYEPVMLFFDIIGMKLYNNANGYNQGNQFLIDFVACLKKYFHGNLICRFSDDHFTVVTVLDHVEEKLNKIRRFVKDTVSKISMDLYVGIYKIEEQSHFLDSIEKAKLACDIQKKKGDNFIRYYDEDLHKALVLKNYVVNHIDEAIANGYIKVYYQPVVRTITETFCGMEALARWIDPEYGFLNPAVFIGTLEESRQIHKLDSHIIELVCKEIRNELDNGRPIVPISFNLSRLDFAGCDIFEAVEKALQKYQIDRGYIRIEITESIMASDSYVQNEVKKFRLVGYEVWMDDFGSGYSSLNTLKDYKFDELKIDMAFLSNFNDVSRVIISSTVRMAKNLGIKTLAEGVETIEQLQFLKGIGCEKVQGFYYGKPQPLKDTMKNMETKGIAIEDRNVSKVYSKLGSLDYLVDTSKAIIAYKNETFSFLFANKQFEEQVLSIGFENIDEVIKAINDPESSAYHTLHEMEDAAYKAPYEMTYASHGTYVLLSGSLVADIDGCHIYDMSIHNTHVSAIDSSSNSKNEVISAEKKTIILADADSQNRAFLDSILRSEYNLLIAEDGEQALNLLLENENYISLALVAADLPKIDGFQIIQKFQNTRRDDPMPFVVMTNNTELAKESIRMGAAQYIRLPIRDKSLIKAKIAGSIKNAEFLRQVALNYMDYLPGGVILFNSKAWEILYVNTCVLDIFECANLDEFRKFIGDYFRDSVHPDDYREVHKKVMDQIAISNSETSQISYRVKTNTGKYKRIYHIGKVFKNTPYGSTLSVFISEDDQATKSYESRKEAFAEFIASGEATHKKSYEPGYKGYLFWNLTKNSPVISTDGISYIPQEYEGKYTYDTHFKYLSSLMIQNKENLQRAEDYTREKLLLDYRNKHVVPSLRISYDVHGHHFTIRSSFSLMMDPDSGDIFLKLQNENTDTGEE